MVGVERGQCFQLLREPGPPAHRRARHGHAPMVSSCATSALLAVQRGYKGLYREAHQLIEDIAEARELGKIRVYRSQLKAPDLLLIDDLFLRKRPAPPGDELADVLMSRYEKPRPW